MSKSEEYKELGGLSILATGLVSKFADFLVDTYINSEGLSLLIEFNPIKGLKYLNQISQH